MFLQTGLSLAVWRLVAIPETLNRLVRMRIQIFDGVLLHLRECPGALTLYVLKQYDCRAWHSKLPDEVSACAAGKCAMHLRLRNRVGNDDTFYLGLVGFFRDHI